MCLARISLSVAWFLATLTASAVAGETVGSKIPERFPQELLRGRTYWNAKTAQVEWTRSWYDKYNDGLVERVVTRSAGDTVWQSNLGNEQGYHERAFRSVPPRDATPEEAESSMYPPDSGSGTRNTMTDGMYSWSIPRAERPTSGQVVTLESKFAQVPFDFASAGLALTSKVSTNVLGLYDLDLADFDQAKFEVTRIGRRELVAADYGIRRIEWELDPDQGGLPVSATLYRGDHLAYRSETTYARQGDRLIPTRIEFYAGDDDHLKQVVDVQRATFDQPWHTQSITPEDIGVRFGTQLFGLEQDGPSTWDGAELINNTEYFNLLYVYDVPPDPLVTKLLAEGGNMTTEEYLAWMDRSKKRWREAYYEKHGERPWLEPYSLLKPGEKDEWDVYVEAFIAKHKLEGDRLKYAKDILDRSKKLRDHYRRKNGAKMRKAERAGETEKVERYQSIEKRIFDQVLVRSLQRLIPKESKDKPEVAKKD